MGDWYVDRNGAWAYDKNAPAPDPTVTGMFPAVVEQSAKLPAVEPEDVGHVDPTEFPDFSSVDSRMIRSIGAPE